MTPLVESAMRLAVEQAHRTGKRVGFARGLVVGVALSGLLGGPSLVAWLVLR